MRGWRWQTWALIVAAVVVLAAVFTVCAGEGESQAATRTEGTPSGPTTIADRGVPIATTSTGAYCWEWANTWDVRESVWPHPKMYAWAIDVEWCANRAQTRVVDLVFHFARDAGGYYDFDGRTKDCGKTGYSYLGCQDDWRFHKVLVPGIYTDRRHPYVRFNLHANGGVTGTVFYDN